MRRHRRRSEVLEEIARMNIHDDNDEVQVVNAERRISVRKATREALEELEALQEQEHINEHAYHRMACLLKNVYEAECKGSDVIELQTCIELVSYDPFIIDSLQPRIVWEESGFLVGVLRRRTALGRTIERNQDSRKWLSHVASYYLIFEASLDIYRFRDYVLVFALETVDMFDVVLEILKKQKLFDEIFDNDGFVMEIVRSYPKFVCWIDLECTNPVTVPATSRWLLVMAAEHATPHDWKDVSFRNVVESIARGSSYCPGCQERMTLQDVASLPPRPSTRPVRNVLPPPLSMIANDDD